MIDKTKTQFAKELRSNQTVAEKLLWQKLREKQLGVKFRRQQPIGPYIVDFVNLEKKLIIELDDGQHNEEANKNLDTKRTLWLNNEGYTVIRFWDNEVIKSINPVLEEIIAKISTLTPTLSPQGRGSNA